MQLVDSHCHIDFEPLGGRLTEVLDNARRNEIAYLLCISVNLRDFPQVLDLARTHPQIAATVGVHPNDSPGEPVAFDELTALGEDDDVVAVGETGLDYFRSEGDLDWQRERFRTHIRAARHLGKPLVVHMRDATDDTLHIVHEEGAAQAGGVMHCFSGDWGVARRALDLGLYLSFSGIVTFKSAQAIQDVARKAPLDRIMVETDAPYLAPVPHRGKTNEPAFVRHTAEFIAQLRGMPVEDFAAATTENFFTLFRGARPPPDY